MARHHARVLKTALLLAALLAAADGAQAQAIDRYVQTAVSGADGSVDMTLDLRTGGAGMPVPTPRSAAAQGTVTVAAVPHGAQRITFRFVNLTGSAIPRFEASLVLPAGFEVAAIDAVEPPVTDATVALPYTVGEREGRPVVGIAQRAMPPGAVVGVTFRCRASERETALFVVLGALGIGYLVRFRDLVARAPHLRVSGSAR